MQRCCFIALLFLSLGLVLSCSKKEVQPNEIAGLTDVPEWFPEIPFPDENQFTEAKWLLGKKLFFDKMLSVDNSISCASCHKPELAFSDNIDFSIGAGGLSGRRNAPALGNVAYHPYYTREGGVPTLEMQILVPIQEHDEFNFNIVDIAERMKQDSAYIRMSKEVFDRKPDPYVITRAIATFERTLITGNSKYDQYVNGGDKGAMSASEVRGMDLFFGAKANCGSCHSGFNFTDYSFKNNGLYKEYADNGRERFTKDTADRALFKVPSLRNVGLTAPYMHDGSVTTLEAVVEHYNSGGQPHSNRSELIKPLSLTSQEKQGLVAFLNALTDIDFVTNKSFKNESE